MPSAVLVTGHYLRSRRRAGLHWIADALHRRGWRVTFMTAPMSWMSWLRRDHRLRYPVRSEANLLLEVEPNLVSYVWWTPWHPASLRARWLDRISTRLFQRYDTFPLGPVEDEVRQADLLLFESTPAIALFDRFRTLNPSARTVYRVSDDMAMLGLHPFIQDAERRFAPRFDLVSTPTRRLHDKFAHLEGAALDPHGVPAHLFEAAEASPYAPDTRNLVFVGVSRFDHGFLEAAVAAHPDLAYHIIGPIDDLPQHPSVIAHGELPFRETVPFVRHASVGLHTLAWEPGGAVFADSLKVQQYAWCCLPVLAPEFLRSDRPNLVCYDHDDPASVGPAISRALALEPDLAWRDAVCTWDDITDRLLGSARGARATARAAS
jgi:2-beta-glucuronyltransferase